jgi:uncharacterized protein YegP (UPF0339 family)
MSATIYVDLRQSKLTKQWRWTAKNANNMRKIATSGESYHNYADCLAAVEQVFGTGTTVFKREAEMGNVLLRQGQDG